MHTQQQPPPIIKPPDHLGPLDIEKYVNMEAMCAWPLGITFLKWLCRLCRWEDQIMSTEHAAIRDIWVHLRRYIPADALAKIESERIRAEQELNKELFELKLPEGEEDVVSQ